MSIFKTFDPNTLPEPVRMKSPLAIQREIILQHLLNTVTGFGIIGLALYLYRSSFIANNSSLLVLFISLIALLLVITAARRLPFRLRASMLVILIAIVSLYFLVQEGFSGTGLIYAVALVAACAVLFGPRAGLASVAGVVLTQAVIGWLMASGRMTLPGIQVMANSGVLDAWLSSILAILLCAICITGAFSRLIRSLSSAFEEQKSLAAELENERLLLDHRVQERTQELSRKAAQIEAARLVASAIASADDTDQLLVTAANVVKDKFDFYQVNIFLNDENSEFTVLRASTGEVGQKLLESNYRLRIGETGIVGFVAGKGKPRIARDVEGDPNYVANPSLPDTRAEFALPLFAKGHIAGVLDIQSKQVNAFLVDDIDVITTLAEQISQAIEKSRLMEDLKNSLADLENSNQQTTQAAWDSHLKSSKRGYAFRYRQARIDKLSSRSPEALQALKKGATIVSASPANPQATQPFATLAIPIKIRNQTLGVVNMRVVGSQVSPDLVELVEGVVSRLAASLENARLLEDIQSRVEREQLVGDIASKVRSATDIDSILRTTAGELGRSLGVSEVVIQLNTLK